MAHTEEMTISVKVADLPEVRQHLVDYDRILRLADQLIELEDQYGADCSHPDAAVQLRNLSAAIGEHVATLRRAQLMTRHDVTFEDVPTGNSEAPLWKRVYRLDGDTLLEDSNGLLDPDNLGPRAIQEKLPALTRREAQALWERRKHVSRVPRIKPLGIPKTLPERIMDAARGKSDPRLVAEVQELRAEHPELFTKASILRMPKPLDAQGVALEDGKGKVTL